MAGPKLDDVVANLIRRHSLLQKMRPRIAVPRLGACQHATFPKSELEGDSDAGRARPWRKLKALQITQ